MRCHACGARNPDGAAWCSQCYARTDAAPDAPGVSDATGTADRSDAADVPDATDAAARGDAAGTTARDAAARDVRTVGGEVEWRCGVCETWTPLAVDRCAVCGAPRRGFGESEPLPTPDRADLGRLTAASALVPGLGHLLVGRLGTGIARMVLAVSWLLGGVAIARVASAGSGSIVPAVPLLLGAAVVWAGTLADVRRLVTPGAAEVLGIRVLTWLTVAVLGAALLALVVTLR